MDEELKQEVFTRLDAIAEKLGVAGEHLWSVLVKQATIMGIGYAAVLLVAVPVLWGVFLKLRAKIQPIKTKRAEWSKENPRSMSYECPFDADPWEVGSWFALAVAGVASALLVICSPYIIGMIINPEYHAIQKIMEAAGK